MAIELQARLGRAISIQNTLLDWTSIPGNISKSITFCEIFSRSNMLRIKFYLLGFGFHIFNNNDIRFQPKNIASLSTSL